MSHWAGERGAAGLNRRWSVLLIVAKMTSFGKVWPPAWLDEANFLAPPERIAGPTIANGLGEWLLKVAGTRSLDIGPHIGRGIRIIDRGVQLLLSHRPLGAPHVYSVTTNRLNQDDNRNRPVSEFGHERILAQEQLTRRTPNQEGRIVGTIAIPQKPDSTGAC
jgi:hypothetical protein